MPLVLNDSRTIPAVGARLGRRATRGAAAVLILFGFATRCFSQAGPPYQTDDPDPVPLHHFEAYVFELSDGTPAGTGLVGPSFEINWGAAPNLQLHLVIPFVTALRPGETAQHGIGDVEIGAKYRFVKETSRMPEIGVFPFVELPAGDASRGLGVGTTWYRFPVWIKKSVGSWKMIAIPAVCDCFALSKIASSPSRTSRPASGRWTPARTLTSVDLPAPFSPTSASISPGRMARLTPSSA